MRSTALAVAIVLAATVVKSQPAAQDLTNLLAALDSYLATYEQDLSTVVADERFYQEELSVRRNSQLTATTVTPRRARRLESEVAFMRLPNDGVWFGVRDVRKSNGKAVGTPGPRLVDILSKATADLTAQARVIVVASAKHNLGPARTINMPTVPLEFLRPDTRARFEFQLGGTDRVSGVRTRKVTFLESGRPTVVKGSDGTELAAEGSAWIEASGRVWRVEIILRPAGENPMFAIEAGRLSVQFARADKLDLVLPKVMIEEFYVPGGIGKGRAEYSNFRRFTTAARMLPQ